MTRLRAKVRRVTGQAQHWVTAFSGAKQLPDPVTVEIVAGDGAFFLLRMNAAGGCLADTWHQTIEDAKAQARSEYEIGDEDWLSA